MVKNYKQDEIILKLYGNDLDNNSEIKEYLDKGYSIEQISACASSVGDMFLTCCYVLLKKKKEA